MKPARIFLFASILLLPLFSFIFLYPTFAASSGEVVINEVYYDVAGPGIEYDNEWVELYNTTDSPIDISNWTIADNKYDRVIPEATVSAKSFALITSEEDTWDFWSIPSDVVKIVLGERIGNGLANTSDRLILKDADGNEIDAMSYGENITVLDPACPDVSEGHSLERSPFGFDSNQASDFIDQENPTPGVGYEPPPPPVYSAQIFINEIMPNPEGSDTENEYVELYNAGDGDVDLSGWKIGVGDGKPKIIGDDIKLSSYLISAGGFLVIYRKDSHTVLNNKGSTVKLWNPSDEVVDEITYPEVDEDWVYQRYPDGDADWSESNEPTAGSANKPSSDSAGSSSSSDPQVSFSVEGDDFKVNKSFDVKVEIKNAKALHDYYVKVRLGLEESKLTKGRTYSGFLKDWFADNSAWKNFPVVYTAADGTESLIVSARVASGNPADTYCIGVRIRDKETEKNYDSETQTVVVGEEAVSNEEDNPDEEGGVLGATTELPATGGGVTSLLVKFWLPVLGWMLLIFIGSSLPGASVSESRVVDFLAHKLVHLFEYSVLFILINRAVKRSVRKSTHLTTAVGKLVELVPFGLTVGYAVTDEIHQSFIPGREAKIHDIIIDAIAAVFGWLVVRRKSCKRDESS